MKFLHFLVIFSVVLVACERTSKVFIQSDYLEVNALNDRQNHIQGIIDLYKDSLEVEMGQVISFAKDDFYRNQPEGALGNLVTDLVCVNFNDLLPEISANYSQLCVLNNGGLRNPISKGDVRVGDVYKLMPFDNMIVWTKIHKRDLQAISKMLKEKGGEPISGMRFENETFYDLHQDTIKDSLILITSDYLSEGNDGMAFMKNFNFHLTGVNLRELLIAEIEKMDTIAPVLDQRIKF